MSKVKSTVLFKEPDWNSFKKNEKADQNPSNEFVEPNWKNINNNPTANNNAANDPRMADFELRTDLTRAQKDSAFEADKKKNVVNPIDAIKEVQRLSYKPSVAEQEMNIFAPQQLNEQRANNLIQSEIQGLTKAGIPEDVARMNAIRRITGGIPQPSEQSPAAVQSTDPYLVEKLKQLIAPAAEVNKNIVNFPDNPIANTVGLITNIGHTLFSPISTGFSIANDILSAIPSVKVSDDISLGGKELANAINLPFEFLAGVPKEGAKTLDKTGVIPSNEQIAAAFGVDKKTVDEVAAQMDSFNSLASTLIGLKIAHSAQNKALGKQMTLEESRALGEKVLNQVNNQIAAPDFLGRLAAKYAKPKLAEPTAKMDRGLSAEGESLLDAVRRMPEGIEKDAYINGLRKRFAKEGINFDELYNEGGLKKEQPKASPKEVAPETIIPNAEKQTSDLPTIEDITRPKVDQSNLRNEVYNLITPRYGQEDAAKITANLSTDEATYLATGGREGKEVTQNRIDEILSSKPQTIEDLLKPKQQKEINNATVPKQSANEGSVRGIPRAENEIQSEKMGGGNAEPEKLTGSQIASEIPNEEKTQKGNEQITGFEYLSDKKLQDSTPEEIQDVKDIAQAIKDSYEANPEEVDKADYENAINALREIDEPNMGKTIPEAPKPSEALSNAGETISEQPIKPEVQNVAQKEMQGREEVKPEEINLTPSQPNTTAQPESQPSVAEQKVDDLPETKFAEVKNIPMKDINIDEGRFQNRAEPFSEETASSIEQGFKPEKFEPIVTWKDPKDGKDYILAGHSRYEGMRRRGVKEIPTMKFEGNEQEAINFARIESNRKATSEDLLADVRAYKQAKEAGYTKQQLLDNFKKESKIKTLDNYSHLSENGQFLKSLNSDAAKSYPYLERNASWIGELRKTYPQLTDAHETELFDYFYRGKEKNSFINKNDLYDKVENRVADLTFKPEQKLSLDRLESTGSRARSDTRDIQKKVDDLKARNRELNNLAKGATPEQKGIFQKEIMANIDQINKLEENIGEIINSQIDIFGQLDEKVKNDAITEDRANEIISGRNADELRKSAENIERKAESTDEAQLNEAIREADEIVNPTDEQALFQKRKTETDSLRKNIIFGEEDGRKFVQIEDKDAIPMKVWDQYSKLMRQKGHDIRGGEDAKYLFTKQTENGKSFVPHQYLTFQEILGDYKPNKKDAEKGLFKAAKKHFGTTKNIYEAGYILPDGDMLDFSGKSEGGDPGSRAFDHRQISWIGETGYETDMQDFIDKGAIRFMPESMMFDLSNKPTLQQKQQMRRIIDKVNGEVIVEAGTGLDKLYREYDKGDTAENILRDIDRHFESGKSKSKIANFRNTPGLYQDLDINSGRTDLQKLQDRKKHLELVIDNPKSDSKTITQAQGELSSINSQLKKLRSKESQYSFFGDAQDQQSLFREHTKTQTVFNKMTEAEQKKFLAELQKGINSEWLIGQKNLTKEQAAGVTYLLRKAIDFDPRTADFTTAWEESFHASIIALAKPYAAKNLLRQAGWDGKGEITDVNGNPSLRDAHEKLAKEYIKFRQDGDKTKDSRMQKIFTAIKEFFNKLYNFLRGKGFVSQSEYFRNLRDGKLKAEKEKSEPKAEAQTEAGLGQSFSPVWYSKLEKVIEEKSPNKNINPIALKAMLKNNGVKDEEIKWLDIDNYLKENPQTTKQELLDYVKANQVEIKEVAKGAGNVEKLEAEWRDAASAVNKAIRERLPEKETNRLRDIRDNLRDKIEEAKQSPSETKFSQWKLPGGENYREVLYVLPAKNTRLSIQEDSKGYSLIDAYGNIVESGLAREIAIRRAKKSADVEQTQFKSSHWDEPNVLAHVRLQDFTDTEGRKLLLVDEVQSDWGQAGRREGFNTEELLAEREKVQKEWKAVENELATLEKRQRVSADIKIQRYKGDWAVFRNNELDAAGFPTETMAQKYVGDKYPALNGKETARLNELINLDKQFADKSKELGHGGVPDMPFKSTWHEFTLKRVLRMAAEEGYDGIAITPGEVQADRYDLSKQIDEMKYRKVGEGRYEIIAAKDGNELLRKHGINEKQIEEVAGKDIAKSIVEKATDKEQSLSGEGLRVGGEGMKGFYDKMIPDFLNKYAKKWGAKVGETEIESDNKKEKVAYLPITDEMRRSVLFEGQPLFQRLEREPERNMFGNPDVKNYLERIAKIENPFELYNWRAKHESEFENMSDEETNLLFEAWNEQRKNLEEKFPYSKYLKEAGKIWDSGNTTLPQFTKAMRENAGENPIDSKSIGDLYVKTKYGKQQEIFPKEELFADPAKQSRKVNDEMKDVLLGPGHKWLDYAEAKNTLNNKSNLYPMLNMSKGTAIKNDKDIARAEINGDKIALKTDKVFDLSVGQASELSTLAPIRAAEIMDGKRFGLIKKNILFPIQDADKAFQIELKEKIKERNEVFKGLSSAEKKEIFLVAENKQKASSEKVQNAADFLRKNYDDLLDRLNKARAEIDKDPIKKRKDYVTHYQELSAAEDILKLVGSNMTEVPASMLAISNYTKPNSPYFKFAKRRLTEVTDTDAEKAYSMYLEPALRSIHFSKAIHDARDILEYRVKLPSDYEGGKIQSVSAFAVRYPNAYKYWTEYLNRLSGKRNMLDKMFPKQAEIAGFTNRLFAAGSIGGNINTVFTQPASLRNTVAETGLFALKGQLMINTPEGYKFYKENSRVGLGRQYEPPQKGGRMLGSKKFAKGFDWVTEKISVPVSIVDKEMVGGAFLSGYYKGKSLGLSEEDAIRYGDDVAERTQASANLVDAPPVNVGKIKTALGRFQTFIYNEWSQIKNDIIRKGIKGEKTLQDYGEGLFGIQEHRGTAIKRLMGFAIATAALSEIYDLLRMPNPYKQEGAKVPGVENQAINEVYSHIINSIPGVSSVRFGGSPIVQGMYNGVISLTGDEKQQEQALYKLQNVGVRLIPAGGQASKTLGMLKAMSNGGAVISRSGKSVNFTISQKDLFNVVRGYVFGKYQTSEGQKYLDRIRNGSGKSGSSGTPVW